MIYRHIVPCPFSRAVCAENPGVNCEILANNCLECQAPDEDAQEGDLRLDLPSPQHGKLVENGKLVERRLLKDADEVMRPPNWPRQPSGHGLQAHWIASPADAPLTEIAAIPPEKRTAVESAVLRGAFLESDPFPQQLAEARKNSHGSEPALSAAITVMRESETPPSSKPEVPTTGTPNWGHPGLPPIYLRLMRKIRLVSTRLTGFPKMITRRPYGSTTGILEHRKSRGRMISRTRASPGGPRLRRTDLERRVVRVLS